MKLEYVDNYEETTLKLDGAEITDISVMKNAIKNLLDYENDYENLTCILASLLESVGDANDTGEFDCRYTFETV